MMASEMIYDNFHNLIIWLEQKQNVSEKKKIASQRAAWTSAFNACKRYTDESDGVEKVMQTELLDMYATQQCIANITAQRRFKSLKDSRQVTISKSGQGGRNFVVLAWGGS